MKGTPRESQFRLWIVAMGLTLGFVATAGLYDFAGKPVLATLTSDLGGIAMARATREEASGNLNKALDLYQQALSGQLGNNDRVHVTKRCGVILWKLGRHSDAIRYLDWAQPGPAPSLTGYRPLAECLLAVDRLEDADRTANTWLEALEGDGPRRADARHVLGKIARERGDDDDARIHFEAAIAIAPYHEALFDLALLEHASGNTAAASEHLVEFLSAAPPGEKARHGWAILKEWSS